MVESMLRIPQVQGALGCKSRAGIYKSVSNGVLTPPVKLGPRASGWPESEIAAVQSARVAGRSEDEIRVLVRRLVQQRTAAA